MTLGRLLILITAILALGSFSKPAYSQDLSNKGREFWIAYPNHVDGTGSVMGVYITSDKAATGNVKVGNTNIPFAIAANAVRRIFIGPGGDAPNTAVYLSQQEGIAGGAGIQVTADVPVVVYAHIIRSARSGASLVLPTPVWGKEYLVPSYWSQGASGANSGFPSVTVMAKEANTVIEIIPKVNSRNGLRPANTPYQITLSQPGDVYTVQYAANSDISGTVVRSIATGGSGCKPIAVFSSTSWSAFNCAGASGGDNLYQQLFPTRSFGRSFLTVPFFRRPRDIIRVFVTDPGTVVTRTQGGTTTTLTGLQAGSYYEFETNLPTKIDADKPISVVQYIISQTCGSGNSDPEMVILNPVEQTINNITVFSAHQSWVPPGQSNVNECFLNIVIQTSAAPSFKINGTTPGPGIGIFQPIPGTNYSYLQANITSLASSNPVQTLAADSSFSAIAYGYGNVESYGYNAGTNVRDLYQFVTLRNEFASVDFPSTCVNTPFHFAITLPYQPLSLEWKFNGAFPDVQQSNPVHDSSYKVDGKTLYRYPLPNSYQYNTQGFNKILVLVNNPTSDGCSGLQEIEYEVQVFDKPKARFTWTHTGCITDTIRFADSSNGLGRTISKWLWDFGDNTTDSIKNPAKKYNAPSTYTVKQRIITDIGCFSDTAATLLVTLPPVAKFGLSTPACVGSPITITDTSSVSNGTIARWYWDYGDGTKDTASSGTPRTHIYSATGTYTVSLFVETSTGCRSATLTRQIVISPFPVPDFTAPAIVCLPIGQTQFTNTSTLPAGTQAQMTYQWNFGDGGTSALLSPLHKYTTVGPFNVRLVATSLSGCSKDTVKVFNNVFAQPKASFNMAAPEVCFTDSTVLTSTSTAAGQTVPKYYWNFGNGVRDSAGAGQKYLYPATGTYNISHWVVSDKGCMSDTATQVQIVNPKPVAAFTSSSPLCATRLVTFTNQSSVSGGTLSRHWWNLGDGTIRDLNNANPVTHTYSTSGSKQVWLVVTTAKGCVSDTAIRFVAINELPVPNYILPEVCLTDAFALFSNTSTIADNSQNQFSYLWNFGDPNANAGNPNTSATKDAEHRYSAIGQYTVSLRVTSKDGCVDSTSKVLTVNGDKPKSDFTIVSPICSSDEVVLANKSTVNFGRITKLEIYWEWPNTLPSRITVDDDPDFDKIYRNRYPTFYTPASKTFDIKLVAHSGGTCVNEIIKTITVHANPKVVFSTIPGICLEASPRQITQVSELGKLVGNGTFSGPGVNGSGLYSPAAAGAGTHTIHYLYVTDKGCRDSAQTPITVWPRPTAAFTVVAPTCVTNPFTLRNNSMANANTINTWNWNFGDGTTVVRNNGSDFMKQYDTVKSYTISLTVSTDSGCASTAATRSVQVHPLPVVDFTLPTVCLPDGKATFTDQSTISDGSQNQFSYWWSFGVPGALSTQKDPVYTYTAVGNYPITLRVLSKDGCIDSTTKTLTDVNPEPLANFDATPASVCLGENIQFTDRSNPLLLTITGWSWDFGNGQASTQQNPLHRYSQAGTYQVKLRYSTNKGCPSEIATKTVVVNPIPVVNAGPDLVVLEGGETKINASATNSSTFIYKWTPATGLSADNVLQPTAKPPLDISYTLTVTGAGGCTASDDVFIKLLLQPEIPNAFSPNGDGINDVWNIKYLSSYPGATITVFDRYGRQIFESKGYNTPWDGKENSKDVPSGVYYYIVDPKNGRKSVSGSVTIIR
jgi:gliding motility-associated-like protein